MKREWENTHVDELSENGVSRELFFFVRGFSLSECIFVKVEFGKVYWWDRVIFKMYLRGAKKPIPVIPRAKSKNPKSDFLDARIGSEKN